MKEHAKALKDIRGSSANITKQIKLVTGANLENSKSAAVILHKIREIQEISKTNAEEAKNVRGMLPKKRAPRAAVKSRNGGN
jgi:hypothetical protein